MTWLLFTRMDMIALHRVAADASHPLASARVLLDHSRKSVQHARQSTQLHSCPTHTYHSCTVQRKDRMLPPPEQLLQAQSRKWGPFWGAQ